MQETKHISEVCKLLGTTSRTIRYYEQLGLIHSTRETPSAPRRLDADNIEQLRRILFLRKIGLSLDEITTVCRENNHGLHKSMHIPSKASFYALFILFQNTELCITLRKCW